MTLFQLDLIVYTDTHTHILHPNRFYYFIIHNENGKSFSKCIEYGWQIIHCSSTINLLQYEIYFLLVLTAWVAHQFVYPFKCFECETEIFSFDSSFYSLFLFLFFCWKWRKTFRNVYFITVLKSYLFHSYIPIYMSTINCYIIPFFFSHLICSNVNCWTKETHKYIHNTTYQSSVSCIQLIWILICGKTNEYPFISRDIWRE